MSIKAGSKRAGDPQRATLGGGARARQGAGGRALRTPGTLPAMRASARRRGPRVHEAARAPRKARRARYAPSVGGRLAAAIRTARLRASRAAEESGLRR